MSEPFRAKTPSAVRRSIRLAIGEHAVAQPLVNLALPVNVFLAALFTKAFDLSSMAIGFISAMPFVCNVLQLAISPFSARVASAKWSTIAAAGLQLLTWFALAAGLPLIPQADPVSAAWWIGAWFFVSSFFGSIAGVWWSAWLHEWVPPRVMGTFCGVRNRIGYFVAIAFLFALGWALAEWDYAIRAFQGVIFAAGALRALSLYWLCISPTPAPPHRVDGALALSQQWAIVAAAKPLRQFILFGVAWAFAINLFAPFYPIFMLGPLGFSSFEVSVSAILALAGSALTAAFWGRLIDRCGSKPAMLASLLTWQVLNVAWCFVVPENRSLAYVLWTWTGITSGGYMLGQFTLLLKVTPISAKNFAIGIMLAVTSVSAAAAPALGGILLEWALAGWPDRSLLIYHLCFAAQPAIALPSALLLMRIQENGATKLAAIARTFARARR